MRESLIFIFIFTCVLLSPAVAEALAELIPVEWTPALMFIAFAGLFAAIIWTINQIRSNK